MTDRNSYCCWCFLFLCALSHTHAYSLAGSLTRASFVTNSLEFLTRKRFRIIVVHLFEDRSCNAVFQLKMLKFNGLFYTFSSSSSRWKLKPSWKKRTHAHLQCAMKNIRRKTSEMGNDPKQSNSIQSALCVSRLTLCMIMERRKKKTESERNEGANFVLEAAKATSER